MPPLEVFLRVLSLEVPETILITMSYCPMVARFRRNLRPINSIKHVVDGSATLTAGTPLNLVLTDAVDAPTLAATAECIVGSRVSSIFLNVEVAANEAEAGIPNVYFIVFKNPSNAFAVPAANAVGSSDLKKFVIHQEMVMLNSELKGNPRKMFEGVIRIPRGYQRQGQDDRLNLTILAPLTNIHLCFQAIFKEYR